jgi:methylmalonyl-CoA mutase N-terminal domain/subunit
MGIDNELRRWKRETVDPLVRKHPERNDGDLRTASGIPLKPLYTPLDIAPIAGDYDGSSADDGYPPDAGLRVDQQTERWYAEHLGYPGEPPFTPGVQPTMYRGRYWTMRQYAGFATAKESNERYRYLLDQGQTGLSVAFDLPTQIGYDSDDPIALGEVGKVGVAIDSLADMEVLFDRIPLDKVSTSMTINAPAAVLLAMYIVVAEKQGVSPDALRGTIQNDILKEYVARGTFIFPPKPSMRLITDTFRYCTAQLPRWNSISISGYHIREAGATAVQEIAFTLADAIAYVDAAVSLGLDVDAFAGRLSFFFSSSSDLLEEVAKFRAVRRMWAQILADRYRSKSTRSQAMRFHTQTSGAMLTAAQPENNVVRVALHALAAVLGGTQSLHTNSRDEAYALPTEESVRIALRTQQIIALESGVANTVDPLAGSYVVESLTDEVEHRAWEYLKWINERGGIVRAIEEGIIQREIEDSAYRWQREIEDGSRSIVGVNCHRSDESTRLETMRHDPAVHDAQVRRVREIRERRDADAVGNSLDALERAAREPAAPLMEPIIEAVRTYATLGEICGRLRRVFGEYEQHTTV